MSPERSCPDCGAVLSVDLPPGLCQRCLLRVARDSILAASGSPSSSTPGQDLPRLVPSAPCDIGDYELLQLIGRGGMGAIYKARQKSLDRTVALKVILSGQLASPVEVRRFQTEAEAAGQLQHPNIVAIHDVGDHEGLPFYTMDYVGGQSLAGVVRDNPLPGRRAAAYLRTIAEAIDYAHQRGILHRDLKPSNVLIDPFDRPRITDFGLAKWLKTNSERGGRDPGLTLTGQALGSPGFMPPEQAGGQPADLGPPSDVYSLGALLYFLLTARPPFVAETVAQTVRHICESDPAPLRSLNPSIAADLETICLKCLEKEPGKRYPTAQALADDLGRFLRFEPIRARPVSATGRLWRWCRRNPALAGAGLAVVILIVSLAGVSTIAAFRIAAARERETAQRRRAEDRELAARRNEYAADMSLAQQALADRNLGRALDLLTKHRPNPGQSDLRGWEWHYLREQSRSDELFTLAQPQHEVSGVLFLRDGLRVVAMTPGRNPSLEMWEVESQQSVASFVGTNTFRGLSGSPEGRWLACLPRDGPVVILDAERLQPVAILDHAPATLAFAPDGRSVYTADSTHVRQWALVGGRELKRRAFGPAPGGMNPQLALSSDGRRVAWASLDGGVKVWDLADHARASSFPRAGLALVFRLSFSPDGRSLAGGCTDGSVRLWSLAQASQIRVFRGHFGFVSALAFSPNGRVLATGGYDQTIMLWDLETGETIQHFGGHLSVIAALAFSPDGRRLVSGGRDGSIRLWDCTRRPRRELVRSFPFLAVDRCLAPDSRTLMTCSDQGLIQVWDVLTLDELARHPASQGGTVGLALSCRGARVTGANHDRGLSVWNGTTSPFTPLGVLAGQSGPFPRLAFSHDGGFLAAASAEGVTVWNLSSTQAVARFPKPDQHRVECLAISPDDTLLAVGSAGTATDLWSLPHGQNIARLDGHQSSILGVAISHDGRKAATASFDHTVRLWDISRLGKPSLLASLTGSPVPAWSAAFSADDQRLAVGLGDGEIRLWNLETQTEVLRLKGHKLPVSAVGFTPDGNALVSVSADSLGVWPAPPREEAGRTEGAGAPQ